MNKKRIIRLLMALSILTPIIFFVGRDFMKNRAREAQAVDPLLITYDNAPIPNPVFTYTNMLPGDEIEEEVKVKNNLGSGSFNVSMDGIMTDETAQFADILEIIITEFGVGDIYGGTTGPKTVQNFLDEPPMDLGAFTAGQEKTYTFKVKFPSSAGNEYQLAKVVFDLKFETFITIELPPECEHLAGTITNVVEGTEGNDDIHGTIQGDLILAKGGNDKIDSSSNSDCVVGGEGNDKIGSESGNDVVIAGPGNDKVESGSGNDTVYGGAGNDNLVLGSGNDKAYGGQGEDNIDGGSGDDEIWGGSQNDTLRGGTDNDKVYGEAGNDNIQGNSGNDLLDGGADTDVLNGNSGTDTCLSGETTMSCEL
jgi:Ca2+-binding RTX toxin-like protein